MTKTTKKIAGVRHNARNGQYVPTLDGKDISPTSFDESRAMSIAEQAATGAGGGHTPGPWKLDSRDFKLTVSGAGKWLATVHRDGNTTTQIHPSQREQESNASLIAAAPVLLAALEHGVALASFFEAHSAENVRDLAKKFLPQMRAAIARAKGQ